MEPYHNIHLTELLHIKTKKSKLNEYKNNNNNKNFKIKIKIDDLHFLFNNILTRLIKKLKTNIRITINNI